MQRRAFLKWSLGAGAITTIGIGLWGCSGDRDKSDLSVRLPSLPYDQEALEPYLSEETLSYHYGKHHKGYVSKINRLISDDAFGNLTLVEIMKKSFRPKACFQNDIFNNAAQVFNHTFYWNSMKPEGGGAPEGLMAEWLDKSFGGYDGFREAYLEAALGRFASGWSWLVYHEGKLEIVNTANAGTPIVLGMRPLLTLDVWEHAYYLDYQNRRDKYIEAFLDHLINWEFAANNLGQA